MVKSVDRALAILEYMSSRKDVGVTEVAVEFELDKGTVSRLMHTFEKHGMAVKSDVNLRYRVGSGVLRLSNNIVMCNSMMRVARPALVELASKLDAAVRLCMIEGKRVFIIDQAEMRKGKILKDSDLPGMSKPLYCSAIGKIILAYMPKRKLDSVLAGMEFVAYTENTITNRNDLLSELQAIRKQEYALNAAEFSDRAFCIAVPIFCGKENELKYCIGITGPKDYRQYPERFERTIEYMKRVSKAITQSYSTDMNRDDE